jgi:hypothetical protein
MRFTAPADASGINIGGAEFVITNGAIEVPNGFSQEGVAALIAHGYTPQSADPVDLAATAATTSAKAIAAKAKVDADQVDADAADAAATQAAADLAGE